MTASDELQVLRLPDGRRLAFAWYGPGDGVPCIVLSGMPGSRLAPAWAFPIRVPGSGVEPGPQQRKQVAVQAFGRRHPA
jgi:hypothetical protein